MAGYAPAAPFHLTESEVIMNELITVNYDNEQPTVSARELHDFLEVGADFSHWFPRMCEYGFEQGRDFNPVKFDRVRFEGNREVKRTVDDAEITIDMAKELCMLQRNDKGKQARQYFLQLERDWNSPEKVMARALQIAHKRIHTLSEKIEQDAPKVLFADSVAASHTSILIFDLAKIVKQNGVDMGGKRLFAWMRDNGYLVRRQGTDYNMPTQRSMELGLFEVKETSVTHSDGHISVNKTPKVTGKGQQYFINRLLGEENRSN
jgi:anti-repressor protein